MCETGVKLCGDCPAWIPGKITYPLGRIGLCGKTGKTTTRTMRCKEESPVKGTVRMKDIDLAALQAEHDAGATISDLARKYGASYAAVRYWLKKARETTGRATEPATSEDFGAVSAAIMESREKPEPNPKPMQLGPWNAHMCRGMPLGYVIVQNPNSCLEIIGSGGSKVRDFKFCPWCGAQFRKEA